MAHRQKSSYVTEKLQQDLRQARETPDVWLSVLSNICVCILTPQPKENMQIPRMFMSVHTEHN